PALVARSSRTPRSVGAGAVRAEGIGTLYLGQSFTLLYYLHMTSDSTFASLAALVRVAVFGASGGVGRLVTEQALGRGHEVVAYVRSPAKLGLAHERLRVVAGELTNREAIGEVVRDADAVISALGPSLDRKASGMPLVDGTRHVIEAMQATGVWRYVGMATPSLRDRRDRSSVIRAIVAVMGRVLLPR